MKKSSKVCLPGWLKALPLAVSLALAAEMTVPVQTQARSEAAQPGMELSLRPERQPALAATVAVNPTQTLIQPYLAQVDGLAIPVWVFPIVILGGGLIFAPQLGFLFGLVVVGDREVGIVVKKFASRNLPPGRLVALEKEAGLQADTLAPGWHWGYWPWQYSVRREPVVVIPQDEIGLVVANDGASIPPERILGKAVICDNFQDGRKFLTRGGEKGRQLGIITTGTYRINTGLFTVITSENAAKHGMKPHQLRVYTVDQDTVGIATTLDGQPIEAGEIAGSTVPGHDNFQNTQKFIEAGGRRGLQEQVILSGSWNLNPWFVHVEQVPMTEVPIGYVGVVISFVGKSDIDVTGESFTHGSLVNPGDKGVWVTPLYPGKHPLNTKVMKVELVPTTNIVLNFTHRISGEHGYDSKLETLKLLSFDGFTFDLEVFQIIHIGALDAPKVISRLGSMQNVVDHVLRPIVGNYFRNSAQEYTILDFLIARSQRQAEAAEYVRAALRAYDVQAVDSLIGRITPPPELMQTLTDRKIAEEQQKTYEAQRIAQTQRQELVRETALADIQGQMVTATEGVKIAELEANARVKQASGEAEAIRLTGEAKADAYRAGVEALGDQGYTALQMMQIVGDRNVRVVPDVAVSGGSQGTGLLDGLMGMLLWNQSTPSSPSGNGKSKVKKPLPTASRPPAPEQSEISELPPAPIMTLPAPPPIQTISEFQIFLTTPPSGNRQEIAQAVQTLTGIDLQAAMDLVMEANIAPQIIGEYLSQTEVENYRRQLEAAGAMVTIEGM
ncbi:ribosomal protein L7/L12 [Leptolyngbya sp. 'hensonii']|uniref:ribosomal protein L7/L12 n=1 Tax=Leptolyngbya sp. 'hensonii' TaxID=1922337 RepID=UPI0009FA5518|nr:ribosomal protein L7/L12 [Leptolyngbya sp. 'hensonii']